MYNPSSRHLLALLLMTLACAGAQAQGGVYRNVGPDGKVTFSDRPPADAQAPAAARVGNTNSPVASGAALPDLTVNVAWSQPLPALVANCLRRRGRSWASWRAMIGYQTA